MAFKAQGPLLSPKSQNPNIKFNSRIQEFPDEIFSGKIFGKKLVSIRKTIRQVTKDFEISAKLIHHENFLGHLFDFTQDNQFYTVMEHFELPLYQNYVPDDLKDLTRQLFSGLNYLHDKSIAHCFIDARNIVQCEFTTRNIFKITNLKKAIIEPTEKVKADDISALGEVLMTFWTNSRNFREHEDMIKTSDENSFCDLNIQMTEGPASMKEIKQHPFIWTVHETLMFIVEVVKKLEPRDHRTVKKILRCSSDKVLSGEDWRSRAEKVVNELTKTNKNHPPSGEFIGLLRSIRNLTVHHTTPQIAEIIGSSEAHLLDYWTLRFPLLVVELFSDFKECKRSFL